jgi:hypothetical protein
MAQFVQSVFIKRIKRNTCIKEWFYQRNVFSRNCTMEATVDTFFKHVHLIPRKAFVFLENLTEDINILAINGIYQISLPFCHIFHYRSLFFGRQVRHKLRARNADKKYIPLSIFTKTKTLNLHKNQKLLAPRFEIR